MKNMTTKEKILFIFLQIITLGLIWIYWKNKTKDVNVENELSVSQKISLDFNKLMEYLGKAENITSSTFTHTKVKIEYKNRDLVDVENIKKIKGISGIFINNNFITIIIGNEAKLVSEKINDLIN